jgi:hypothetical protein
MAAITQSTHASVIYGVSSSEKISMALVTLIKLVG